MTLADVISIIAISAASSAALDYAGWRMVYSQHKYKDALAYQATISARVKALEDGTAKVKANAREEQLANAKQDLMRAQKAVMDLGMRPTLLRAFVSIAVFYLVSSLFDGIVVARLPFEPVSFFRGMFQRGLVDPAPTDCGYLGIFVLSNMCIGPILGKVTGWAAPTVPGSGMGAALGMPGM